MKKILVAVVAFIAVLTSINWVNARVRGTAVDIVYLNACGSVSSSQTWCVGTDGWTLYSGTVGNSGTACNTGTGSTWNGTCVVSVTNSGNDGTCKAEPLTAGITSATLSTFTPALPCATLSAAQALLRTSQPDWLLLKKGDSWDGGFNGATSGAWAKRGKSVNEPMVILAYGTGARPKIVKRATSTAISQYVANGTNGQYTMLNDIEFYFAVADPNSSDYLSAILTGDVTSGGTTITNVTVPSWVQNGYNGSGYKVYGSGLQGLTATWSAGTPNTLTLSGGTAGFTATGLKFQIVSKDLDNTNPTFAISTNNVANLFNIENVYFNYSGAINTPNQSQPLSTAQLSFRRNFFKTPWSTGGVFVGSLTTTPAASEYVLFEENVLDRAAASTDTSNWAGTETTLLHCLYFHDPGPLFILNRNVLSNCASSAHQMREGTTYYNNLHIANPYGVGFQQVEKSTVASYNVIDHGTDLRLGFRLATADSAAGATSISYDGQYGRSGALVSSIVNVVNLSNPGSLPEWGIQGTSTTTKSANTTASPTSVSLTFPSPYTGVQAGVRGDGVKTGDILQFTAVSSYSTGVQAFAGGGLYVDAGPNTTAYPANSTVSISNASPAVFTDTVVRSSDEIFQLTSGSPPAGTSLSTDYCTTNVNTGAKTYNVYPATAGSCPGVSGNAVNTSASGSGIGRQGSRKFTFATPIALNFNQTPIPSWVVVGTSVCQVNRSSPPVQTVFSGSNGCSTVSWISSDRLSMFTTDPVAVAFFGGGSSTLTFGLPDATAQNPTFRFGPNNLVVNSATVISDAGDAINVGAYSSYFDVSGNYIYNWNPTVTASNVINTVSPWAGTNTTTQVTNVAGSTSYPWASVDAYDAVIQNNSFTGTLSANGNGGSYLDVTGGGGPSVGDVLFAADGSNSVSQYMKVTSQVSSTRWITNKAQAVGPITMLSGSYEHFIAQALLNSKDSWNFRYTARAANNFIRTKLKCGDQTAYPSSALCPAQ